MTDGEHNTQQHQCATAERHQRRDRKSQRRSHQTLAQLRTMGADIGAAAHQRRPIDLQGQGVVKAGRIQQLPLVCEHRQGRLDPAHRSSAGMGPVCA